MSGISEAPAGAEQPAADSGPSAALSDPAPSGLRRLLSDGLWSVLAYASTAGSAFIVSVLLARAFGPDEFGRYSYSLWLLRTLPVLLTLGIPAAVSKLAAEHVGAGDRPAAAGVVRLAHRVHAALIVPPLLIAVVLSFERPSSRLLVWTVAVGVCVTLYLLDAEAVLTAFRRFRTLSVFAVASGTAQVAATSVGIAIGLAWEEILTLFVAVATVGLAALSWLGVRQTRPLGPGRLDADQRRAFRQFAAVGAFTLVVNSVLWDRPELFFLELFGSDADLGYYSAAVRLASVPAAIPLVAGRPLLPEFARLRGALADRELGELFPQVCRVYAGVAAPLAILGAMLCGPALRAVYGDDFTAAVTTGRILIAGSLVGALSAPATAALFTGPRPRVVAELGIAAAVVNLGLDLALIPTWGIEGAATANVTAQLLWALGALVWLWRRTGLRYPVGALVRATAVAVLAAAAAVVPAEALGGFAGVAVGGGIGLAVYAVLAPLAGVVSGDELRRVFQRPTSPAEPGPAPEEVP